MSVTQGVVAAGSYLQIDFGSGLTTVAEVQSIAGVEMNVEKVDSSSLLSNSVTKEKIPGWGDGEDISCEAIFTSTQLNLFYTIYRLKKSMRIVSSNGSTTNFVGFLTKFGQTHPLEDKIMMPFTIAISGFPTFSP